MDEVEKEYTREIVIAIRKGDTDKAHELDVGLRQYQELYKITPTKPESDE